MQEIALTEDKIKISASRKRIYDNIDDIIDLIANNISYKDIAKRYDVSQSQIFYVLNSSQEYRTRKEDALKIASYQQIDEAKQYLESIEAEDTNATVRKKSELSQFSVYLAKVKNRKEFDLNFKEQDTATNNNIITPQLTLKVVNQDQKITIESE